MSLLTRKEPLNIPVTTLVITNVGLVVVEKLVINQSINPRYRKPHL